MWKKKNKQFKTNPELLIKCFKKPFSWVRDIVQVAQHLSHSHEALNSSPSTARNQILLIVQYRCLNIEHENTVPLHSSSSPSGQDSITTTTGHFRSM
jgi:hypothetical protein